MRIDEGVGYFSEDDKHRAFIEYEDAKKALVDASASERYTVDEPEPHKCEDEVCHAEAD
mgnify:CR=1 FL=1